MSKRLLLFCAPALACLCACVSYPPYERDTAPPPPKKAKTSEAPATASVRCYNLKHVTTWSVEGNWSDAQTPSGRLRQAGGEGPWSVLVLLREESQPRAHVVSAGALVGEWGEDVLMIDDSGRSGSDSPSWSYVPVTDDE